MKKNIKALIINYIGMLTYVLSCALYNAPIHADAPWMPNALKGDTLNVSGDASICGKLKVMGALYSKTMGNLANIISPDGSVIITPDCDSLGLESTPLFGNVLRVDAVYGSDCSGDRNTKPFATIDAALQTAQAGDIIILFPGIYHEKIVIPNDVSVIGLSAGGIHNGGVRIVQTEVTTNTDLVTMGENSTLENVTLELSATTDVQLRGIVFPGTTSATARVNGVLIQVMNTAEGFAPAYGVHSIGTGLPSTEINALQGSIISITSQGLRASRGLLVDTAAHNFNLCNCSIAVRNVQGGSAFGIETNSENASCIASVSSISGTNADISQTAPTSSITIVNSELVNSNANALGFTASSAASILTWAMPGTPPSGISCMVPGTGSPVELSANLPYIMPKKAILKNLRIHAINPPGTGSITFTVLKNNIPTTLTSNLVDSAITNANNNASISCSAGDKISLQINNIIGTPTNISATIELY
jgi:hypothetical protein